MLQAQITAGDGRFRGIRHSVARDDSDAFPKARTNPIKGQMLDPTWRAGFGRLAPLNLTFEAWLYHPQLPEVADLARAYPQTTIILNHVGGPLGIGPYKDKKAETFAQWKVGITEVAKSQNVVVKLGGLGMPIGMFDFYTRAKPPSSDELAAAYKPYIETCIAVFGVDRAMFESNLRLTERARVIRFCGTHSNGLQPAIRYPKKRLCSAAPRCAFTAWPEFPGR